MAVNFEAPRSLRAHSFQLLQVWQLIRQRFTPQPRSADYLAWRQQFIHNRLWICLWLGIVCFATFAATNYYQLFLFPEAFNKQLIKIFGNPNLPDQVRALAIAVNSVIAILLLTCLYLQRTRWGRRNPTLIFLSFSWSLTIAPQIVGSMLKLPDPGLNTLILVFLCQATLIPVSWRLHLLSQLAAIFYWVGVNSLLGMTQIEGHSIFEVSVFVYIFWVCAIADFAVFLYERLKYSEFEAQRELRVFLHAVSHDLRNPVMGAAVVLQSLLRRGGDTITVKRTVLEQLVQGSDRQLALIDSLLEAHASEVRGLSLQREPLPLHTLVEAVLADLAPTLAQHQVKLVNLISSQLPQIDGDRTQLWRVYTNLLANALKHNPDGIQLTLDATVNSIVSKAKTPYSTPMLYCTVQDNGVGIDPQHSRRLFDLYSRGSRARYMPGLGLGLYLCKQIITAHGGDIGVISTPGEGATFWFTLPISLH